MIKKNDSFLIPIFVSGFFLFLDQTLKFFAKSNTNFVFYLYKNIVGWEFFANNGIAFSLPIPNDLLIFAIPIILFVVFSFWMNSKRKNFLLNFSVFLIVAGAISNFIDRILFEYIVDYIKIYTAIFNIADLMIITGGILLAVNLFRNEKKQDEICFTE